MYCSRCGTLNADHARFCKNCGLPLTAKTENADSSASLPAEESVPDELPPQASERYDYGTGTETPAYSDSAVSAAEKIRGLAGSRLFKAAAAAYSLHIILDIIASSVSNSRVARAVIGFLRESGLGEELEHSGVIHIEQIASSSWTESLGSALTRSVPAILTALGLWMIYTAASERSGTPMRDTGLKLLKVIQIIAAVFAVVGFILGAVFALLCGLLAAASETAYSDYAFLLILGAIVLLVIGIFAIVYLVKIIRMISSAQSIVRTGIPGKKVSMYVIVITAVSAGLCAVDAFSNLFSGSLAEFMNEACEAFYTFAFLMLILKFRFLTEELR